MAAFDTDLFVIGGGSGGVRAARIASQRGARVTLAEEDRLGGTCVIRGCVPKKLMVYASKVGHEAKDVKGFGWTAPDSRFDWPLLRQNIHKELDRLENAYKENLKKAGVTIIRGRAVIRDQNAVVMANGAVVRANSILIATGGVPYLGEPIPGIEHVISSNEVFGLPQWPATILIQGGGYIALEFAGIFSGLGSKVVLVHRSDNVLRGFDEDIRQHIRGEIEASGVRILSNRTVAAVHKRNRDLVSRLSDGTEVTSDQVLFAIGRRPNIAKLGLDRLRVAIDPVTQAIIVNQYSQTSVSNIFAVGDVTHRCNLTPVAIREGHAFAETLFGNSPITVDHANIPTAVFSHPEIGTVGLTEATAKATFRSVDAYKTTFRPMKSAFSLTTTRVTMKLIVDAETDRVLGCHIVGDGAGELIQVVGIAIKLGATKAQFDATVAVHPTAAEELVTMSRPFASHRSLLPMAM
jgi:glutathione reductase (NADPH)